MRNAVIELLNDDGVRVLVSDILDVDDGLLCCALLPLESKWMFLLMVAMFPSR